MTKDMLGKIKEFAAENFCMPESEQVYGDDEEFAVTNPWMDHSGRFELDDVGAVKEWGLDVVLDFCAKAEQRILNAEINDKEEYDEPILEGFVWRHGDNDLSVLQVQLPEKARKRIETILSEHETDGCSVRNVYNSRFSEIF